MRFYIFITLMSFIYFGCSRNNSKCNFIINEYKYPITNSAEILLNDSILIGKILNVKYEDSKFILNYELFDNYNHAKLSYCYEKGMINTFRVLATYDTLKINKMKDMLLLKPCEDNR